MLTNNFLKLILASMQSATRNDYIDINGESDFSASPSLINFYYQNLYTNSKMENLGNNYTGIVFGTGNSQESKNSIFLDNRIDNSEDFSPIGSISKYDTTSPCRLTLNFSWKYTGTEKVTIKEIGIINKTASHFIMYDRTVLKNPIEVKENDIFIISWSIGEKAEASVVSSEA